MISKGKKAVLHIAKSQLGLSRKEYMEELKEAAGVSSSVDLDNKGFAKVMRRFKALGYVSCQKGFREIDNLPAGDREVMSKINAIRLDMGKEWAYVDGIAKHAFGVASVQWVKGENLRKLLNMMIYHQKRRGQRA